MKIFVCRTLKLLLGIIVFTGSVNAFSQSVPLPSHKEIDVIVSSVDYKNNQPYKVVLRLIVDADVTERLIELDEKGLYAFRNYLPISQGQAFKLRMSLLVDADGKESMVYNVIEEYFLSEKKLNHQGFQAIRFGQAIESFDGTLRLQGESTEECHYAESPAYPEISLMIDKKKIARIDFNDFSSVIIDTPFYSLYLEALDYSAWKSNNPEIEISPHEYQDGDYLIWWSKDQKNAIVAEYVNGKIIKLRAGLSTHVTLVEGCS